MSEDPKIHAGVRVLAVQLSDIHGRRWWSANDLESGDVWRQWVIEKGDLWSIPKWDEGEWTYVGNDNTP